MEPRSASDNLFFIGFMGAGKTTIGRTVARRLGRPFFDTDHEIESRCGVRITTIFELEGEEGFRRRETRILDELTQRSGIVLATGGGIVLRPENREMLRARGHVIYLDAALPELWRRVRRNRNRPLLQVDNPRARLEALFCERDPLYREIAHLIMPAHAGTVAQAAASVLAQLGLATDPADPSETGEPGDPSEPGGQTAAPDPATHD
ncbi:Shikimate kinase I [Cupriavidus sp. U2]|nr:Shikimate kinase I [Cupriavidus sp. U2]